MKNNKQLDRIKVREQILIKKISKILIKTSSTATTSSVTLIVSILAIVYVKAIVQFQYTCTVDVP